MANKCISPNSLDHGLQAYLQARSITASYGISKLIWLWPPCSKDQGIQAHVQIPSRTVGSGGEKMKGYVAMMSHPKLVLATVPGYPAVVRVWNWTGWSSSGCYLENRGTQRVRGWVGTGPRFYITVPATLPPIKYLSSDCMVTWSVRKLCSFSPSFTSRCQICDWANIHWIAVK